MLELSVRAFDAVVLDMDGVVTDTAVAHRVAWKTTFDQVLAELPQTAGGRVAPFRDQDYLAHVDGRSRADGVAGFLRSRGVELPRGGPDDPPDRATVWGVANRKNAQLRRVLAVDGARAFPSTVALVRDLQAHGVGTAVVTASRNCTEILHAAGIGGLFTVQVDGLESARLGLPGKPDPATFLEAARRLGCEPGRAVVVEDALAGVRAGRAGRFGLVIGVDRVGQADALRRAGADAVVADLAEVGVVP